VLQVIN